MNASASVCQACNIITMLTIATLGSLATEYICESASFSSKIYNFRKLNKVPFFYFSISHWKTELAFCFLFCATQSHFLIFFYRLWWSPSCVSSVLLTLPSSCIRLYVLCCLVANLSHFHMFLHFLTFTNLFAGAVSIKIYFWSNLVYLFVCYFLEKQVAAHEQSVRIHFWWWCRWSFLSRCWKRCYFVDCCTFWLLYFSVFTLKFWTFPSYWTESTLSCVHLHLGPVPSQHISYKCQKACNMK